jgi:hypothetical protein
LPIAGLPWWQAKSGANVVLALNWIVARVAENHEAAIRVERDTE